MKRYNQADAHRKAKGLVLRKWRGQLTQAELVERVETLRTVYKVAKPLTVDVYGRYERGEKVDIPDDHIFLLCLVHGKTQQDLYDELLKLLPVVEKQLRANAELVAAMG